MGGLSEQFRVDCKLCMCVYSYSASQDVLIHEIAHAIHAVASRTALPTLDFWISESYREAQRSGLWTNTYANTDHLEYFAEGIYRPTIYIQPVAYQQILHFCTMSDAIFFQLENNEN